MPGKRSAPSAGRSGGLRRRFAPAEGVMELYGYDEPQLSQGATPINRLTSSSESGTSSWTRYCGYDEWPNGYVTLNTGLKGEPGRPDSIRSG